MISYKPDVRSRAWFLWPFWSDTLEPFMFAAALGGAIGSVIKGDLNLPTLIIVLVSYPIAVATRWPRRGGKSPASPSV